MDRWLGTYSDRMYALMRVVVGLLFACHGAQKLFGVLGGHSQLGNPKLLAAGIIEFGGGSLIALGLFAGFAALVASGEMAFAYFTVHAGGGLWPIVNKGELAVLYCFVFLYVVFRGSGPLSVDALARKRRA
jgi:putative oxidoreductase